MSKYEWHGVFPELSMYDLFVDGHYVGWIFTRPEKSKPHWCAVLEGKWADVFLFRSEAEAALIKAYVKSVTPTPADTNTKGFVVDTDTLDDEPEGDYTVLPCSVCEKDFQTEDFDWNGEIDEVDWICPSCAERSKEAPANTKEMCSNLECGHPKADHQIGGFVVGGRQCGSEMWCEGGSFSKPCRCQEFLR